MASLLEIIRCAILFYGWTLGHRQCWFIAAGMTFLDASSEYRATWLRQSLSHKGAYCVILCLLWSKVALRLLLLHSQDTKKLISDWSGQQKHEPVKLIGRIQKHSEWEYRKPTFIHTDSDCYTAKHSGCLADLLKNLPLQIAHAICQYRMLLGYDHNNFSR